MSSWPSNMPKPNRCFNSTTGSICLFITRIWHVETQFHWHWQQTIIVKSFVKCQNESCVMPTCRSGIGVNLDSLQHPISSDTNVHTLGNVSWRTSPILQLNQRTAAKLFSSFMFSGKKLYLSSQHANKDCVTHQRDWLHAMLNDLNQFKVCSKVVKTAIQKVLPWHASMLVCLSPTSHFQSMSHCIRSEGYAMCPPSWKKGRAVPHNN